MSTVDERASLRHHLPLTVGSIALVTLGAFANRAVGTVLPTIVQDLSAVSAFGLASAAPAASYLAALAVAGPLADRRGARSVMTAGAGLFALAELLVAVAPTIGVVVAGRVLSGIAEALLDVSLMVLVARTLPSELRPKIFAVFAAAWVLPSIVGPVVSGTITELVGWRWLFLATAVLTVPAWLLLLPAVRGVDDSVEPDEGQPGGRLLVWGVVSGVAALTLSLAGEQLTDHPVAAYAGLAVAVVVLAVALRQLLPRGILRARRGLPALYGVRALVAAGFGGIGPFLPLLLTLVHEFRPSVAGISLTSTGIFWAVGSWLQSRTSLPRSSVLRVGTALLAAGVAVSVLMAVPGLPPWWGLAGWALAGVGMGLSSASMSVLVLDLSAEGEQGRSAGYAQSCAAVGVAVAQALGGAVLAAFTPVPGAEVFVALVVAAAVVAVGGAALATRVAPRSAPAV